MRDFKPEDFDGSGQYIIRNDKAPDYFTDAGFMSTVMYKVGYMHGNRVSSFGHAIVKISMADGWTTMGYFNKNGFTENPQQPDKWTWVPWTSTFEENSIVAKQKFCDYLNNPELSQEYRFATHEELMRVCLYQKRRCR
tara:strand:- start:2935 stop:3348 length:414 start_codon:yes stop_codon:yes gene_type:complete